MLIGEAANTMFDPTWAGNPDPSHDNHVRPPMLISKWLIWGKYYKMI